MNNKFVHQYLFDLFPFVILREISQMNKKYNKLIIWQKIYSRSNVKKCVGQEYCFYYPKIIHARRWESCDNFVPLCFRFHRKKIIAYLLQFNNRHLTYEILQSVNDYMLPDLFVNGYNSIKEKISCVTCVPRTIESYIACKFRTHDLSNISIKIAIVENNIILLQHILVSRKFYPYEYYQFYIRANQSDNFSASEILYDYLDDIYKKIVSSPLCFLEQ